MDFNKFTNPLVRRNPGFLQRLLGLGLIFAISLFTSAGGPKLVFNTFNAGDGLSQDVVVSLFQDMDGFVWIGTQSGLNRFDGYEFIRYMANPKEPGSLSSNEILSMYQDREGTFWVGTQAGGLNRYRPETDDFQVFRHDPDDPQSLSFNAIQDIEEDDRGNLWIPTWGGGLNRFDPHTGKAVRYLHDPDNDNSPSANIIWDFCAGKDGTWWLATMVGVDHFDPKTGTFTHYVHDPENPNTLPKGPYLSILELEDGRVLIGTEDQGVAILEPDGKLTRLPFETGDEKDLNSAGAFCLAEGENGDYWVGTPQGLSRYRADKQGFSHYSADQTDPQSIASGRVWRMLFDRRGNLWTATTNGVSMCRPDSEVFGYYQHKEADRYQLSESYFVMGARDERYLWMGSNRGLVRFDRREESFKRWLIAPEDPEHPVNQVTGLGFDRNGRLWLSNFSDLGYFDEETGSFRKSRELEREILDFDISKVDDTIWLGTYNGVVAYDPKTENSLTFSHNPNDSTSLSHDAVIEVFADSKGRLWVGTYGAGLNLKQPDDTVFKRYRHDPADPNSLVNDAISIIVEGEGGTLWIGTREGLSKWVPEQDHFVNYGVHEGLPNPFINGILEDDQGYLWLSTDAGISRFDPKRETNTLFDVEDGLLGKAFSGGAFTKTPDGALVFGGEGFNLFRAGEVKAAVESAPSPIRLTDLLLFNEPVRDQPRNKPRPLEGLVTHAEQVTLSYKDYVFAFRFAALDYHFSERTRYEYKLQGLDSQWIPAPKSRIAGYTTVKGGNYVFRVRGLDKNGVPFQEAALPLRIQPPPWKTVWAYLGYILLILGLMYAYVSSQQAKLEKERRINQRLNEVDRLKDAFLANTSHELRTPLHGMIGLAEALLDSTDGQLPEQGRDNLRMIVSSGMRLSNLVNDILDFSKLEHNSLNCKIQTVDLKGVVSVVLGLMRPLVGQKELELVSEIAPDLPPVMADENRLQQVLFNLVGNGVKFTEKGEVTVKAEVDGENMAVSVCDTGIGISEDKCEQIFIAFEQADGGTAREYGGTGLGLAVTRKLVEIMGGDITVTSEPEKGSIFRFTIPLSHEEVKPVNVLRNDERRTVKHVPVAGIDDAIGVYPAAAERCFNILVVDDDPVNRMVLVNHLSRDYHVVAVESGLAAIAAVEEHQGFDLILLDVMMPKMTGFDVCRHLRTTFPSHELPVIYLTAKAMETDVVTGFETGANDFIIKPVSKSELLMRVETHLQLLDANRNLEAKVVDRTRHLVEAQKELLREAHTAGMAEIAVDIMHNVGNRLNSLGTSVQLITELAEKDGQGLKILMRFNELVEEHADDLTNFLINDERVAKLPTFLPRLTKKMRQTHTALIEESAKMTAHLEAMSNILAEQQKHTGLAGLQTDENLNDLIRAVLRLSGISVREVEGEVALELAEQLPQVRVSRVRLTRVFMCLFQNALEALEGVPSGLISLSSTYDGKRVRVVFKDNGRGIDEEIMVKIFAYGFTTKNGRNGFGLHYCANTLREMGAGIRVDSEGPNQGTVVTLTFIPVTRQKEPNVLTQSRV